MIDRSRLFFFQAACTAAMRADGHGGCGSGVQPQLADGPSMPERRLRVGGQRVPRKSNECRLDKLFFSAGQSSALFVANCSGRTVAIRTFRRDRRSRLGSESDGPYGDTVPDCVQPRYVTAKVVPEGVLAAVWAKFSDDVEIPEDLEDYVEEQMDRTLKKGPQRERTGTRDLVGCPAVRSDTARWPHLGRPTQPCWTPMEGHSSLSICGRTPAKGKRVQLPPPVELGSHTQSFGI